MLPAPEQITTARLQLRRPSDSDAAAIFEAFAGHQQATRYMAWPRHQSVAETLTIVQREQQSWQRQGAGMYVVLCDNRVIGTTGLHCAEDGSFSTGYGLTPAAWGKGYATELMQGITGAAATSGINAVSACVHPQHSASIRVLEKSGFQLQGSCRPVHFPNIDETVAVLDYRWTASG